MAEPNKLPEPQKRLPPSLLRSLFVYATAMLFLFWLWQSALSGLTSKEIEYSRFKQHVAAGEARIGHFTDLRDAQAADDLARRGPAGAGGTIPRHQPRLSAANCQLISFSSTALT